MKKCKDKKVKDYGSYFLGGLFGGGDSGSSTQTSVRTVPSWLLPDVQNMVSRAVTESNTPYQQYTGQRVAEFTPDQLASFNSIRNLQGQTSPYMEQALGFAQQVGDKALNQTSFTPDSIQQFMNPYQQNVTDISKRETIEDLDRTMNSIGDSFYNAGAFGGDRQAILEAEAIKDTNQRLSDLQYSGLRDAYNTGSNLALQQAQLGNQGLGIAQSAASNLANIATAQQSAGLRDASALQNIGGMQQALDQAGLDVDYGDFLESRDWEKGQLGFLSSIINPVLGSTVGQTSTGTSKEASGSPLGTVLGLATGLSGLFAEGGMIPKNYGSYAEGGFLQDFNSFIGEGVNTDQLVEDIQPFVEAVKEAPSFLDRFNEALNKGVDTREAFRDMSSTVVDYADGQGSLVGPAPYQKDPVDSLGMSVLKTLGNVPNYLGRVGEELLIRAPITAGVVAGKTLFDPNISRSDFEKILNDPQYFEGKNLTPKQIKAIQKAGTRRLQEQRVKDLQENLQKTTVEEAVQQKAKEALSNKNVDQKGVGQQILKQALEKSGMPVPKVLEDNSSFRTPGINPSTQTTEVRQKGDGFFGNSDASRQARIAAGLAMMSTKGGFSDQIAAGMNAFNNSKKERSAAQAAAQQQDFENRIKQQKADAYLRQLELQERAQDRNYEIDKAELGIKKAKASRGNTGVSNDQSKYRQSLAKIAYETTLLNTGGDLQAANDAAQQALTGGGNSGIIDFSQLPSN